MSVSEGLKKNTGKTYYVKLVSEGKKENKVKIQPWTRVLELKSKVGKIYGVNVKHIRLFFCNTEMLDDMTMLDYKIIDQRSILNLS
jgi:hypothetical protein